VRALRLLPAAVVVSVCLPAFAQTPSLTIADKTVTEGHTGSQSVLFTVTLSGASSLPVTVHWATANGTATSASGDYVAGAGDLTFTPPTKKLTFAVLVNGDLQVENDETFRVKLSQATNATLAVTEAFGTILNDDLPAFSISDRTLNEGDSGTQNAVFMVSLSVAPLAPATVHWATANGNAQTPADYAAASGDLSFDPGVKNQTLTVVVNGDTLVEQDETFKVKLSQATGASIADGEGLGTIIDNDKPAFTITDRSVNEGDAGTVDASFSVALSSASPNKVITVNYATVDGTAASGPDFTGISGTLTFQPGEKTKSLVVKVKGDNTVEADETFKLKLNGPTNATLAKSEGLGTIRSDDFATVSIGNVALTEGNAGSANAVLTVTVSPAAVETSTVHWATANGTATLNNLDYEAASGELSFAKGQSSKTVSVKINGDLFVEPDETVFVNLSQAARLVLGDKQGQITIRNNDTTAVPEIRVNDVTLNEGNAGTSNAVFTVSLNIPALAPVAVTYTTANGTATAGSDYVATSARLTLPAGSTSRTFAVMVNGDLTPEANETFFVNLSAASNATIKDKQGKGTITNDDTAPPPAPRLTSPSGSVTTRTPTYRWTAATGATEYVLSVHRPSGASVVSETLAAAAVCTGALCAATPAGSLGDGDHSWWVKARNSAGASPASEPLSFVVSAGNAVVSVTSHDDGQAVSARGFLVSGRAQHASGISSLAATLDDPLLGRSIDRPLDVAPVSGRFTLWVHEGEVSPGETVTVILTALLGNGGTESVVLGLMAQPPDSRGEQMLARITFGSTPALRQLMASLGPDAFLEEQLNPGSIDDSALEARLAGVPLNSKEGLQTQTLLRAAYSRRQLQEVLTQFWDNHFNTDINKVSNVGYEVAENNLFRQNALGRFRDLLAVSSASPAMLIYLDNNLSVKGSPNENYSRELQELHTLGVDGGYTQNDVNNVAKAFTGWQIQSGQFFFDAADHDTGQKLVLGQTLPAGRGIQDGWDVLDILARHPSTARFVCKELAQLFVADAPPNGLIDGCSERFLASDGQISELVRFLLTSPEFSLPENFRAKVKNPEELVISSVRALDANSPGTDLAAAMSPLGMRFFENPVPTGWSETGDDWISANTLLERSNFVNKVARATGGNGTTLDAKAFFQVHGFETAEGIAGFLFDVALAGESSDEERKTALEILSPPSQPPFDITAGTAAARIQRLVGTVLSYPGFQFQ
jgi:Protein of unknown function (DUF1800)/Calx-beta domain